MISKFARFLNTTAQVDDFLAYTLGLDTITLPKPKNRSTIHSAIITCEKGVLDGIEHPTSISKDFRDRKYSDEAVRLQLRTQIVDELFSKKLFKDDDKIFLGKGGSMPTNPLKEKEAFILIGLPASGKSYVAAQISEANRAVILDSDFAKRKLPEYGQYPWGASLVNSESSMIVFGDKVNTGFPSLYEKVVDESYNVVIPKIGSEPEDIIPYCESLYKLDYKVHLTLVYLPKEISTIRALLRYIKTDRYVPLTLIFDVFGNNPALTYFKLKNANPDYISSFGIVNTDVAKGKPFHCTDLLGNNPAQMFTKQNNVLI